MNSFALAAIATTKTQVDPNDVKPGWLALSIVIILCVATYFLLRSFVKHSRKANEPWDSDAVDTNDTSSEA